MKKPTTHRLEDPYWRTWKPDDEHLNALPKRLFAYVHDLATRADPASDVQVNHLLKDENAALRALIEKLQRKIKRLERGKK